MKIPKGYMKSPYVQFFKIFCLKNGEDMPLNEETEVMSLTLEGALIEYLRGGGADHVLKDFGQFFKDFVAECTNKDGVKYQVLIVSVDKEYMKAFYEEDGMVDGTDADLVILHLNQHPYNLGVMEIDPIDFQMKSDKNADKWILTKASIRLPFPIEENGGRPGYKAGKMEIKGAWIL